MAKRLNPEELYAHFVALKEAADHLRLVDWTGDMTSENRANRWLTC